LNLPHPITLQVEFYHARNLPRRAKHQANLALNLDPHLRSTGLKLYSNHRTISLYLTVSNPTYLTVSNPTYLYLAISDRTFPSIRVSVTPGISLIFQDSIYSPSLTQFRVDPPTHTRSQCYNAS